MAELDNRDIQAEQSGVAPVSSGESSDFHPIDTILEFIRNLRVARLLGPAGVVATGGLIATAPTAAEAQTLEATEPINQTVTGTVTGKTWNGEIDLSGSLGGGLKLKLRPVDLSGKFGSVNINGTSMDAAFSGEVRGGVLKGTLVFIHTPDGGATITATCHVNLRFNMSGGCSTPGCGGGGSRTAAARPVDPCLVQKGRVPIFPVYGECTFYAESAATIGKPMGAEGFPRGFDATANIGTIFYISGPVQTTFDVYVRVPLKPADRSTDPIKAKIVIDGQNYDTDWMPMPKGGTIIPGTESGVPGDDDRTGLLSIPIKIPIQLDVPEQTHTVEIALTIDSRIVVKGPHEVTQTIPADSRPAIQEPLQDDPSTPATLRFPAELQGDPDSQGGYRLDDAELSQVPIAVPGEENDHCGQGTGVQCFRPTVCPISNGGGRLGLVLSRDVPVRTPADRRALCLLPGTGEKPRPDAVIYRLEGNRPAVGNTKIILEFERKLPPVEATDPESPDGIPLELVVTDAGGGRWLDVAVHVQPHAVRPLTCQANRMQDAVPTRTNVTCWTQPDVEGRVSAYAGTLDPRPIENPLRSRRHWLHKLTDGLKRLWVGVTARVER